MYKMAQAKNYLLLIAVFLLTLLCRGTEGYKTVENYTPEMYGLYSQNPCILQDHRGILYVANQGGILEYDGVSWRVIKVPNLSVLSMDIQEGGTIYLGGLGELGYLAPNGNGTLEYTSLVGLIPEAHRNFDYVYQVCCVGKDTWFRTATRLFRWRDGKISVRVPRKAGAGFKFLMAWKGNAYVQEMDIGLQRLEGGKRVPIPGCPALAGEKIYTAVPFDRRHVLLSILNGKFYLFDGTVFTPFATEAEEIVHKDLSHGIRLQNGDFALATKSSGVVIIDARGRIQRILDRRDGLQSDYIWFLYQDNLGNLWLGLDKGISRVQLSSAFSFFDKRSGLNSPVLAVVSHRGRLYAGTTEGLFVARDPLPGKPPRFEAVPGVPNSCRALLGCGDSLLVGTDRGTYEITGKEQPHVVVRGSPVMTLSLSRRDPGRVWVGTTIGLMGLRREQGRWLLDHSFKTPRKIVRSVSEEPGGDLWLGGWQKGVARIRFPEKAEAAEVTIFEPGHGLPEGIVFVAYAAGRTLFAIGKGLYRFEKKQREFVPEGILGEKFTRGDAGIYWLVEDRDGCIWFAANSGNGRAVPSPGQKYNIDRASFLPVTLSQVNSLYHDGSFAWFATENGLVCFNGAARGNDSPTLTTLLRKVIRNHDDTVYGGFTGTDAGTDASPFHMPLFSYRDRDVRFEVAAPYFQKEAATRYRFFLEGHDDDWTKWGKSPVRNYPKLGPGRFTMRVQARNIYGVTGSEDRVSFRVTPPWTMTTWAYLLYTAAAILAVFLVVKWRSRKLILEKIRLERIIEARTREINRKNTQLEQKTEQLQEQSEQLKEMDKVKSRFFANISHEFRTPLTLILGPLEHIRDQLREEGLKEQTELVHRNARRLLGLINQLLDLSRLESGKMILQAEEKDLVLFLKGHMEPFELAAQQQDISMTFHNGADAETVCLYFDPEKMEKIMSNLLSNALKFTPAGGSIEVTVSLEEGEEGEGEAPGWVVVRVQDTGAGIPGEAQAHVFERFYQAEARHENHRKGSGIGLSLTRELVELHHGEISVSSRGGPGPGSGTEFVLRFLLGRGHLEDDEVVEVEATAEAAHGAGFEAPGGTGVSPGAGGEGPEDVGHKGKNIVLVVEDNADLRSYVRNSLEPDYEVLEAEDGRLGLEKARTVIPDLVISDIMMPGPDGYEVCRTLKDDRATSHIPVILLTAKTSEESVLQGLETGADDYITKPFNTRLLRARIKNLIDLRLRMQQIINREMRLPETHTQISRIDKEFFEDLRKVIEKNISEPDLNVEALSKRLYMSRTTLYRKIQALSGETPTDFIRSYRLRKAAKLLENNFGSVTEVAFEVGFSSRAYFTKCFKEKFHQLPSEYIPAGSPSGEPRGAGE